MSSVLKHVGVLGMKWGIRRGPASADHTKARELKKKRISELSNKDIQTVVTRLQLEKSLKTIKDLESDKINRGRILAVKLLYEYGPMIVSAFVARYAKKKYDNWKANPTGLPIIEGVVT